jgi:hypothetical protein
MHHREKLKFSLVFVLHSYMHIESGRREYDCGQSLNPAVDLGQVSSKRKTFCADHYCISGNVLL